MVYCINKSYTHAHAHAHTHITQWYIKQIWKINLYRKYDSLLDCDKIYQIVAIDMHDNRSIRDIKRSPIMKRISTPERNVTMWQLSGRNVNWQTIRKKQTSDHIEKNQVYSIPEQEMHSEFLYWETTA